jgi:hypothetical protein
MAARQKRSTRRLSRWLAIAALLLIGFLYWKPIRSYLHVRDEVAQRSAQVRSLAEQQRSLRRRLVVSTSTPALADEARRLGFVRAGERLFIVKGIPAWRRHRATIARHG